MLRPWQALCPGYLPVASRSSGKSISVSWKSPFPCTSQHGGAGPSCSSDLSNPVSYLGKLVSETSSKDGALPNSGILLEESKEKPPFVHWAPKYKYIETDNPGAARGHSVKST